jgi:ATP/ADP translocase
LGLVVTLKVRHCFINWSFWSQVGKIEHVFQSDNLMALFLMMGQVSLMIAGLKPHFALFRKKRKDHPCQD